MTKRTFFSSLFYFMFLMQALYASDDVRGFWKTIDENSGKPQSIVGIYEHQGKYYGRIIATYDPQGNIEDTIDKPIKRAPGVVGEPYYSGIDFIWGLKKNGNKYVNGKIMDPEKGKIYDSEMWREGDNLVVRGKILFFGRNQTWPPAHEDDLPKDFKLPDLTSFVPKIPQRKLK